MINKSKEAGRQKQTCRSIGSRETHFEPVGQGAQQLDFDGQADERRHAAVGDGGCELDAHRALSVIHLDGRQRRTRGRVFRPRVRFQELSGRCERKARRGADVFSRQAHVINFSKVRNRQRVNDDGGDRGELP